MKGESGTRFRDKLRLTMVGQCTGFIRGKQSGYTCGRMLNK